jgi:hypothetical protein
LARSPALNSAWAAVSLRIPYRKAIPRHALTNPWSMAEPRYSFRRVAGCVLSPSTGRSDLSMRQLADVGRRRFAHASGLTWRPLGIYGWTSWCRHSILRGMYVEGNAVQPDRISAGEVNAALQQAKHPPRFAESREASPNHPTAGRSSRRQRLH